ncbi:MAG TPA: UDP-3-O-(3-hydroxymyristoyl)glucosamine N-acyltransferase [Planctomycetota bacterium]|nr:UDP-3-O-(3-hydroxymyristoyl)glucosamine N-acyltransferase [Planctomycetota bacterium]
MTTRTLDELASACGASLEGDGTRAIRGPAGLRDAQPDQIAFCAHPRFRAELEKTGAGAVLVPRDMQVERKDLPLLRCDHASRAFTAVVRLFAPPRPVAVPGIHPSAIVEPGVELGAGVSIGPLCHVGKGARLGARTILRAHVEVGEGARIGEDCEIFPNVVLYDRVELGARCVIHAGTVLGSDGHGFDPRPEGWVKVPQCGIVVLEDDVEIGANATVDRARFGETRIGRGTKIDNLVHIGHNVVIGANSMIVAQVGISGSTRLGRGVVVGGQAGISGHLELGDGVRVGGGSAVVDDWPAGVEVWGFPARPFKETVRNMAHAARADELVKRVRELEKRLKNLEESR